MLLYAPSEADANVLYATHFFCPDPFIFIRTNKGKRIYVMSDLEIDRARRTSNADRVLSLSHYTRAAGMRYGKRLHPADVMAVVLRDLRIRSVIVPESFPSGVTDRLRDRGIAVRVVRDPFFAERLRKTPAEAGAIRGTMRAAENRVRVSTAEKSAIGRECQQILTGPSPRPAGRHFPCANQRWAGRSYPCCRIGRRA